MPNPLSGQVIVEPIIKKNETESGLMLSTAKDTPLHGIGYVKSFNKSDTPAFTVGDKILYLLAESSQVVHDGHPVTFVPVHAVLAVIED